MTAFYRELEARTAKKELEEVDLLPSERHLVSENDLEQAVDVLLVPIVLRPKVSRTEGCEQGKEGSFPHVWFRASMM